MDLRLKKRRRTAPMGQLCDSSITGEVSSHRYVFRVPLTLIRRQNYIYIHKFPNRNSLKKCQPYALTDTELFDFKPPLILTKNPQGRLETQTGDTSLDEKLTQIFNQSHMSDNKIINNPFFMTGSQEVTSSSLVCSTKTKSLRINDLQIDSKTLFVFVSNYWLSLLTFFTDIYRHFRTFSDIYLTIT